MLKVGCEGKEVFKWQSVIWLKDLGQYGAHLQDQKYKKKISEEVLIHDYIDYYKVTSYQCKKRLIVSCTHGVQQKDLVSQDNDSYKEELDVISSSLPNVTKKVP